MQPATSIYALLSILVFSLLPVVLAAPKCGSASGLKPRAATTVRPADGLDVLRPKIAAAWLPGWLDDFDLDEIPWNLYSYLTYAFAVTTDDASMISLDGSNKAFLENFVTRAHKEHVGALVSIGGWTGSLHFSKHVKPSNQDAFLDVIIDMVNQYDLDGIDFDWEYPNKAGIGCNAMSPDDSKNFLSFLQKLREHPVGSELMLTAAVAITPFAGPDGSSMNDVSEFATVLDFIAIMNYDLWGAWSPTVGPNAPLYDYCAPQPMGSAKSAVKTWTGARFPASQILLGVPAYGHSYFVNRSAVIEHGDLAMYPPFNKSLQPPGEGETANMTTIDQCGNHAGPSGNWQFEGMVKAGFLQNIEGFVMPASGMQYKFDQCSETPFIYNPKTQVMISYDDALSFTAKGLFIDIEGLAGFAMWDASGDTAQHTLIKAISSAMGPQLHCGA